MGEVGAIDNHFHYIQMFQRARLRQVLLCINKKLIILYKFNSSVHHLAVGKQYGHTEDIIQTINFCTTLTIRFQSILIQVL
jgi:hypothetical protein